MLSFLLCLAILIAGYFTYGKFVTKTFGPDDRETPAVAINDGVDYVVMPQWKLFLVQLLNIAGLGPIFGALTGAEWGPVVYLWITFGTIFAGGVHDYFSGMLSERNRGASISEVTGTYLGDGMKNVMRVFSVILLIMVGTVFAVGPAGLLVVLFKESNMSGIVVNTTFWLTLILIYYFIATFISIDQVIGRIYPIFGVCLIVMAIGVGIGTLTSGKPMPESSSCRETDLELYVHYGCLWSNFRLPLHPVSSDGTLYEEREAGTVRVLRCHGGGRNHRSGMGGSRLHTVWKQRAPGCRWR